MKKRYELLISEKQDEILTERSETFGFSRKSDYIRFMVFMDLSFIQKINEIHNKICGGENAAKNKTESKV